MVLYDAPITRGGYEQPHTFGIYNVRMSDDPELKELWGKGDTIKAYAADEKRKR